MSRKFTIVFIYRVVNLPATNVSNEMGGDITLRSQRKYSGRSNIILGGVLSISIVGISSDDISPVSHRVLLLNSK